MTDKQIVNWKLEDAIATDCNVSSEKANKVIKLLNDGSTVPFIARYRKEHTGNLPPTTLHKIKEKMEECIHVIEHIEKSMKSIEKSGLLSDNVKVALQNCKSMEDVEFVTEPFKSKGPRTLAGRARQAGLEPLAMKILYDQVPFVIEDFVPQSALDEFGDLQHIEEAIRNIIADVFAKDITLLDGAEKLNCPSSTIVISSLKRKWIKPDPKIKIDEPTKRMIEKLRTYHSFQRPLQKLLSHQVMAINRGERHKILKVTVQFPESLKHVFLDLCNQRYLSRMCEHLRPFVTDCALDAYQRLVQPHLVRKIRSQLTRSAHAHSLSIFEVNLRHLVMARPLPAVPVLGVDPGHYHGTKLAVVGADGLPLETAVVHLARSSSEREGARGTLLALLERHKVGHVAVGDGCGSGAALTLVSDCLQKATNGARVVVVRECGASAWSVSEEAAKDLPGMDPALRSAVSLARRLRDPLAEYVRMPPRALGLGSYQHDLTEGALSQAVARVLQDCIAAVGADLNQAPAHVLVHVPGLGPALVSSLLAHRRLKGPFVCRRQLRAVRGLGEATFRQIAGFLRVRPAPSQEPPATAFTYEPDGAAEMTDVSGAARPVVRSTLPPGDEDPDPLDQTAVHPESYEVARTLITLLGLAPVDIGTTAMQQASKGLMADPDYLAVLSQFRTESCGLETLQDIVVILSRPLEFDERNNYNSAMLRDSYGSSGDLRPQQKVVGCVSNVTAFGMFLDIGVERPAFSPRVPAGVVLGDAVEGVVVFVDAAKLTIDRARKVPRF